MEPACLLQLLSLSLVLTADVPSEAGCESGWFGISCRYKCHCENNSCDVNGECIASSRCKRGWFGPACQYVDLVSTHAGPSTPRWVYDFPDQLCNAGQETVTISLLETFYFSWLRLRSNPAGPQMNIGSSTDVILLFPNPEGCVNLHVTAVSDTIHDIHSQPGCFFKNVTITGERVRSLCSIYISGGRNVALRQSTSQSSAILQHYVSSLAVDGVDKGICAHTDYNDSKPTWRLQFQKPHQVNRYVLYKTADVPISSVTIVATYTVYTANKSEVYLKLCEVEMFGDAVCPTGLYGRECERRCNCAKAGENCFFSTGGCISGCATGYQWEGCQKSCDPTFLGDNCKNPCNLDCKSQKCHAINGTCISCAAGRSGDNCTEDCAQKRFGENCKEICSTNCSSQLCGTLTGKCGSCIQRRTGDYCDQALPLPTSGDTSLPIAVIVGPASAVIALVIMAVIGVFLCRRRRKRAAHRQSIPGRFQDDAETESRSTTVESIGAAIKTNRDVFVADNPPMKKSQLNRGTKANQKYPVGGEYCNYIQRLSGSSFSLSNLDDVTAGYRNVFPHEQSDHVPADGRTRNTAVSSPYCNKKAEYNAYDMPMDSPTPMQTSGHPKSEYEVTSADETKTNYYVEIVTSVANPYDDIDDIIFNPYDSATDYTVTRIYDAITDDSQSL